jgi:PIN domain nuclease of toxin-antitoxin system
VKLLLDTHVLLWAIDSPALLSKRTRTALLDESNEIYASIASIWEITIKVQAGKLVLPTDADYLEENLVKLGISGYVSIDLPHIRKLSSLPPAHKDPFDRLLIAQAMSEGFTLVSKDRIFRQYPAKVFW